jgi:hypothetical protein
MECVGLHKRKRFGAIGALMLAALTVLPVADAAAEYIRVFVSADRKVMLVCHYSDAHVLRYCNVNQ